MGRDFLVFSLLEEDFPRVFYGKMLSSGSQIILKRKKRFATDFSSNPFKNKSFVVV